MSKVRVRGISFRRSWLWPLTPKYSRKLHTIWRGDVPDKHHAVNQPEVQEAMGQWAKKASESTSKRYYLPGFIVQERRFGTYQEADAYDLDGNQVYDADTAPIAP